MNLYPAVDPIPLPAPIWLFKTLHILTMSLHFVAVEMLLGGLLVATCLSFLSTIRREDGSAALRLNAAASLSRRLPVVMTYVINLGVPPLLFAQVLYGRALYTSSILMGTYWIAVIFLLMACYWLLYRFNAGTEAGKSVWWLGGLAWLLAGCISRIYSTNMALMLRPEVWGSMYTASAAGALLPPHDPTLTPRWLFMLAGGLALAGLWMIWLAGRGQIATEVRTYLSALGGRLALAAVVAQLAAAHFVVHSQPDSVRAGLEASLFYRMSGFAWFGGIACIVLVGLWAGVKRPTTPVAGWLGALAGFVTVASMTIFRDGIRDLTLLGKGLDVWGRVVVTNWSVVGLFLALFVAGVVTLGWLMAVMARAKPVSEKVA